MKLIKFVVAAIVAAGVVMALISVTALIAAVYIALTM